MRRPLLHRLAILTLAFAALPGYGAPATNAPPSALCGGPGRSVGHRILWYVPNRLADLADIVRLRARVGPGLAVNVRATKWGVFYAGQYRSLFAGLPGPRQEARWPLPVGVEQEKGLALLAVDATDTLRHEPVYTDTELTLGLHLAVVGAEAGFDPVELVDFVLGLAFLDIRRDDH